MRCIRTVILGLTALFIFACGGGGVGGTAPTSALIYTTDWTLHGAANGGESQKITVTSADGSVAKTLNIERASTGIQNYRVEGLPNGSYVAKLQLYSDPRQLGSLRGIAELPITVQGDTGLASIVGTTPDSVQVLPTSTDATVPESRQFYAVAKAAGSIAFVAVGGVTWTVSGSIGSVSPQGVLQTSQAGMGVVRASLPSGKSGTATATVSSETKTTTKWTILVFMNAANDLFPASTLNMNQMELAAGNPDVRFVVQWKQARTPWPSSTFDTTRRYVVRPDSGSAIGSQLVQDLGDGIDMGSAQTLRQFIGWAKTYYPAQRYGLVVWNHGNGWRRRPEGPRPYAVSYDDETGHAIQTWDLVNALGNHHFEFMAWDASLMQMMEVAYEVRNNASYVVGSEESPPANGYPYDVVFGAFRDRPDDTSANLTKAFVDGMLGVSDYRGRKITQSVVDCAKLPALEASIDALAGQLMANSASVAPIMAQVRNDTQSYSQNTLRTYRDLYDLCLKLEAANPAAAVVSACQDVRAKLTSAIVWEGHNANSPNSHGLSIDLTKGTLFMGSANDYAKLQFGRDNKWDDWLVTTP